MHYKLGAHRGKEAIAWFLRNRPRKCHLYDFIESKPLDQYFTDKAMAQVFITAAKILPEVIKCKHYYHY
jgi:hypothetical protein